MTARIPESIFTWLVDQSILAVVGNMMPPRDLNDDEKDEDDGAEADDDLEQAVVREPDE